MRIGLPYAVIGVVLLATASTAAERTPSNPMQPGSNGVVKPSTTGVVKSGSVVDPGMKVVHPKGPVATMPVIKPRTTTQDGSVVVPR